MSEDIFNETITVIEAYKEEIHKEMSIFINKYYKKDIPFEYINIVDAIKKCGNENLEKINKLFIDNEKNKYNNIYLIYINKNVVINLNEYMYNENTERRLIYTLKSNNLVCIYTDDEIKRLDDSDTIICTKNMKMRMFNMSDNVAYFIIFDK